MTLNPRTLGLTRDNLVKARNTVSLECSLVEYSVLNYVEMLKKSLMVLPKRRPGIAGLLQQGNKIESSLSSKSRISSLPLKTHINTFFLFVHNIEKNSLFQMLLVKLVGGAQNSTIINRAGIIL